jgi:hypothetical protein
LRHALKRMSRGAERHHAMRDGRVESWWRRSSVPASCVKVAAQPDRHRIQRNPRRAQPVAGFLNRSPMTAIEKTGSPSPARRGRGPYSSSGRRVLALSDWMHVECATTVPPLFIPGRRNQRNEEQDAPRIRQTGTCRTAALHTFWALGHPKNAKWSHSCVLFRLGGPGNRAALAFPGKEAPGRGCCSGVFAFSWGRRTQKPSRRSFNQGIPSWRTKRSGSGSKRTIIV